MNPWMVVSRKGKGRIQKENEIVQSSNHAPNSQIKEGCRFEALNNVEIMGEDIEFTKDSQDHRLKTTKQLSLSRTEPSLP